MSSCKLIFVFIFAVHFNIWGQDQKTDLTPFQAAQAFELLNFDFVPEWESLEELQNRFETLRDAKLELSDGSSYAIPWKYPRDGCHTRAAMMIQLAENNDYKKPKRIFMFGVLKLETENDIRGYVEFWFHSAPVVRVNNEVYVLDATVDYDKPLTLEQWRAKLATDIERTNYSFCEGETYLSTSSCHQPIFDQKLFEQDVPLYSKFETNVQKYLKSRREKENTAP